MTNPVMVREAARAFADRIGVDPSVLFVELDRVRRGAGVTAGGAETILKRSSAQIKRERALLQVLAQHPELLEPHLESLVDESFVSDESKRLWVALRAGADPATEYDPLLRRGLTAAHVAEIEGRVDADWVAELVAAHLEAAVSRRIDVLHAELDRASDEAGRHAMLSDLLELETERRRIKASRV